MEARRRGRLHHAVHAAARVDDRSPRCFHRDRAFTLYEDEGDTCGYEQGRFAAIPLAWNEATQTLTIGDRKGEFPGMLKERTFHVVFVGAGHGVGIDAEPKADRVVKYGGTSATVTR